MYTDAEVVNESLPDGVIFYSPKEDCSIAVVYRNTTDYLDEHNGYRIPCEFLRTCAEEYRVDRVIVVQKLLNVWYEYDLDDYFKGEELAPRLTIPAIASGVSRGSDLVLDLSHARSSGSLLP
jgi:hypothetical protein